MNIFAGISVLAKPLYSHRAKKKHVNSRPNHFHSKSYIANARASPNFSLSTNITWVIKENRIKIPKPNANINSLLPITQYVIKLLQYSKTTSSNFHNKSQVKLYLQPILHLEINLNFFYTSYVRGFKPWTLTLETPRSASRPKGHKAKINLNLLNQ